MTIEDYVKETKDGEKRRFVRFSVAQEARHWRSTKPVFHLAFRLNKSEYRKWKRISRSGKTPQIHHDDCNSTNDHPMNLKATTESDHQLLHGRATRFSAETCGGDKNGHRRMMKEDADYRKRFNDRTSEVMSEYWNRPENKARQSIVVKQQMADPVRREATKRASRAKVVERYMMIAKICPDITSPAAFDKAKKIVCSRIGVKTIIVRHDFWTKCFASYSAFTEELKKVK
jgi:hypothetical protein